MTSDAGAFAERAVVIGGSIAGLLAARVLATHFREVVIIDRDTLPDDAVARSTVPQEHHVHLLLARGKTILERLFPGFLEELEQQGAVVADLSHDILWFQAGHWKNRWPTGIWAHYCTRTLIEHTLRQRIRRFGNVRILQSVSACGFVADDVITIRGVLVSAPGVQGDRLDAGLVVDASGRGSRTPAWLQQLGLDQPPEETVTANLGYVSRLYDRLPEYEDKWKALLVFPKLPYDRRLAVVSPVEGRRWLVTAGGWLGAFPDCDEQSFLSFLKGLPVSDIYDVVSKASPAGELRRFKMPGGVRRRYDMIKELPAGLLVLGDAQCCFNPLYSQGMSVCALTIEVLEQGIPKLLRGELSGLQLQSSLGGAVAQAWNKAKAGDSRFPETAPPPTLRQRLNSLYFDGLTRASATNRDVMVAMLRVTNLLADESSLRRPRLALKAAAGAIQELNDTRLGRQV